MAQNEKSKSLRMLGTASRGAGTVVGTAAAAGKNAAGLAAGGVRVVVNLLSRPVEVSGPVPDEEIESIPGTLLREPGEQETTVLEGAPGTEADTRRSDLAQARCELGEARAEAEKVESEVAVAADEGTESPTAEPPATGPPEVAVEEVRAAVFPDAATRIIFTRVLSDIASQNEVTRVAAARTMGGIRHELSAKALVARLTHEPSPQVRKECVKALAALQMKEGLSGIEGALADPAPSVRLAAVWSMYRLGGEENVHALARMLSDQDEEIRRRSATCIGWLGREELAVDLSPLLDDSAASVRRAAAEAMGILCSRQVISALVGHLDDSDESVRTATLRALEVITGKKLGEASPANKKSHQRLITRWHEWWKEKLSE